MEGQPLGGSSWSIAWEAAATQARQAGPELFAGEDHSWAAPRGHLPSSHSDPRSIFPPVLTLGALSLWGQF